MTLTEVGELLALELEEARPRSSLLLLPPPDWDPDLVPILTALSRAAFVTPWCQPGAPDLPYLDEFGVGVQTQRAFVSGFASDETLRRIRSIVEESPVRLIAHRALPQGKLDTTTRVPVSVRDNGETVCWTAITWPRGTLRRHDIPPAASEALDDAWQVSLIDMEWGRNDELWPRLEAFAHSQR